MVILCDIVELLLNCKLINNYKKNKNEGNLFFYSAFEM